MLSVLEPRGGDRPREAFEPSLDARSNFRRKRPVESQDHRSKNSDPNRHREKESRDAIRPWRNKVDDGKWRLDEVEEKVQGALTF